MGVAILSGHWRSLVEISHHRMVVFRRGHQLLPGKVHQVVISHIDLVRNPEWASRNSPEIIAYDADRQYQYENQWEENAPHRYLDPRVILPQHPDEKRSSDWHTEEQTLIGPTIG